MDRSRLIKLTMPNEIDDLRNKLNSGELQRAPREELFHYVMILGKANAPSHFGGSEYPQVCETVRMLLAFRVYEDENRRATRIVEMSPGTAAARSARLRQSTSPYAQDPPSTRPNLPRAEFSGASRYTAAHSTPPGACGRCFDALQHPQWSSFESVA